MKSSQVQFEISSLFVNLQKGSTLLGTITYPTYGRGRSSSQLNPQVVVPTLQSIAWNIVAATSLIGPWLSDIPANGSVLAKFLSCALEFAVSTLISTLSVDLLTYFFGSCFLGCRSCS